MFAHFTAPGRQLESLLAVLADTGKESLYGTGTKLRIKSMSAFPYAMPIVPEPLVGGFESLPQ